MGNGPEMVGQSFGLSQDVDRLDESPERGSRAFDDRQSLHVVES